jgi:ribosomal protein S18 acetylase RimI-like enzyme
MHDLDEMSAAFDTSFRRRAPQLVGRTENADDASFLSRLFAECSPLAGIVPAQILATQAKLQHDSHKLQYPNAMRRIVGDAKGPFGRIIIDWSPGHATHGVDIAVLPEARSSMAGLHMLRAWLEVADHYGKSCTLDVLASNPAKVIYERLGFITGSADPLVVDAPVVTMARPAFRSLSDPISR